MAERLDQALEHLRTGTPQIVAGGTDYFPALKKGGPIPYIVDVSRVAEMKGIRRSDEGWRIGGSTTWSDVIRSDLPAAFDGLKAASREVGSIQIQNTATLAGNLCNASPAADGVPCLLSLDASVELAGPGTLRVLPLYDFITGVRTTARTPTELLTAIHVPALPDHVKGSFQKLGSRRYLVISITMVGAVIGLDAHGRIDHAAVAVGACSAVAQRQKRIEQRLLGQTPEAVQIMPEDLDNLAPIEDVRGDPGYRLHAACEQIIRAVREASAP